MPKIEPRERPILFSGPMVRAVLAGRKTQTRRIIKPQPDEDGIVRELATGRWMDTSERVYRCPYGVPGDRLWVKETHAIFSADGAEVGIGYRADHPMGGCLAKTDGGYGFRYLDDPSDAEKAHAMVNQDKWRPSIFMPRWASRITLAVTCVRAERLHDITGADATAEGIRQFPLGYGLEAEPDGYAPGCTATNAFAILWDSINAKRGFEWSANPWVWVIEFRKVKP